ncbi:SGNH/GDSL hydrolase family protein [Edaphobacter sp. HDX4]|uniref:SGNH/GDSL hydrolase family protein n=1 Tax=Edaphobacter sp. HDX4 TaxID=2794064 RepID=UPI002FE565D1
MRWILAAAISVGTMWGQAADAPRMSLQPDAQERYDRMLKKLADWPDLTRYRQDDASAGDPKPGERRVVFLGASITDFWGRKYGTFFPGEPYINRGISGQVTSQLLVRFQQDVIHLKPAAVIIADAGANNIAGNGGPATLAMFRDDVESMVAIARANHIRVILASLLPASRFPWKPEAKPAEEIREWNAWLKDYATEHGIVYLDYYSALVDEQGGMKPELAFDKAVHPNAAGYALMQPLAENAINKALERPAP